MLSYLNSITHKIFDNHECEVLEKSTGNRNMRRLGVDE
jgi:hypothetical protein